jgi:hypothetical protein
MLLHGILTAGGFISWFQMGKFSLQALTQFDQCIPEGKTGAFVQARFDDAGVSELANFICFLPHLVHSVGYNDFVDDPGIKGVHGYLLPDYIQKQWCGLLQGLSNNRIPVNDFLRIGQ